MTWEDTTELREKLEKNGIEWSGDYDDNGDTTSWRSPSGNFFKCCHDGLNHDLSLCISPVTPDQAIAATLGWIDEPDTIRNELADGGLIADALAPVCVDEKERRAFERGRVHERFAQQIFKEATS